MIKNILKTFFCSHLLFWTCFIHAQNTGIGIGITTPDPSAAFEVADSTKGILIPRMSLAKRMSIPSPAEGLMVYQTDGDKGFWYFSGNNWLFISASAMGSTGSSRGATMRVFTSTTSFTVPDGVYSVIVELWGAGGGASGGHGGLNGSWGKQSVSVIPGVTYTVEVGVGGGAGGGSGSSSSFNGVYAQGGRGGCGWPPCPPAPVSNAQLWCNCAVPVGSVLGYGIGGTSDRRGSNGLVIMYY